MNWSEIIFSVVSVVLTALASWGVSKLIAFINSKIENEKTASLFTDAVQAVANAVKATYQTYVQALKGTDMWTTEAQTKALEMALETAKSAMSEEVKEYIEKHFGDIDAWITSQTESTLYDLKNGTSASTDTTTTK